MITICKRGVSIDKWGILGYNKVYGKMIMIRRCGTEEKWQNTEEEE